MKTLTKTARWIPRDHVEHTLKVGDVLYSSWGYDQTNIDFYQVTRLVGKQSVEVREIASESTYEDRFMSSEKRARPGVFLAGDPKVCRVVSGGNNTIKVSSYAHAWPDDGRYHRYSWYA
jgi:hypothetical protein